MNLNAWKEQLFTLVNYVEAPPDRVVGFQPDGRTAWVVDSSAKTIREWDVATGQFSDRALKHPFPIGGFGVSPDGRTVATGVTSLGPKGTMWTIRT